MSNKYKVAIQKYEKPYESVKNVLEEIFDFAELKPDSKVFIKPNIVFWTRFSNMPKWGVITTSRVVQDVVELLKEFKINDITIGEGSIVFDPKDRETQRNAFESLGYNKLQQEYGVKLAPVFEREFEKVDLKDEVVLNFNSDILQSDFVINLPVLKTHAQTKVSLGIKNLKGTIDIKSRKKCHNADPIKDLNFYVAKLADKMPPMLTLLDGIYTIERGPGFDGKPHRSNLLVASKDVLSADLVGSRILGIEPREVPHLVHAAKNRGRSLDLSDIEVIGSQIEEVAVEHEPEFAYNEENTLPKALEKLGIQGLSYPKYDTTMCTYCSALNGLVLTAIAAAWKGEPWDEVEVLTGKKMQPDPSKKKTILLGQCMYKAHKDNPNIQEMIPVKGCPPKPEEINKALHQAGIMVDTSILENAQKMPGFLMSKFKDKPEFEEGFYKVEI